MSTPAVVLIVEKSRAVRDALREYLEGPYRILEADRLCGARSPPGGSDARGKTAPSPDLILSDLRATDQQAPALYRRLEADPALEATPVLLLVPPAEGETRAADADKKQPALPPSISPEDLRRLVGHHLAEQGIVPGFPAAGPEVPLPEKIETVVQARLGDPSFAVDELAEVVDLSRRQLTRRMKEAMGTTPAAYIRARRIEQAEKLLAEGSETIAAVAAAVGFASPSAFSKAFREQVGCPPSTYAERHGE